MTTMTEKLSELTRFSNKAQIGRAVGLSPGGLANILTGKSVPGSDTLLKLARVLNVSADWLFDPEQDFPPVRVERRAIGSPVIIGNGKARSGAA
jgi:transcriptional regulator with XRE-family HTH domain